MTPKLKPKPVTTALTLPTSYNQPSDDLLDYFLMIFGRKNIGKSTFGSSYPDALNFQLERGRQNLSILMVPKKGDPAINFKSLNIYLTLFCESEHKAGVIDTADAWYDLIYYHYLNEYGGTLKAVQDAGNSFVFWSDVKMHLENHIQQVQDAGKTLIFISHEKAKEKQNSDGTMLERIEPSCAGPAMAIIQRYCDNVFHYDWVANDRVLTLRSTNNAVWTSCGRNDTFLDPDGAELKRIKIPNRPDEGFETLEAAFRGELRDLDYKEPKKPLPPKKKGVKK